VRKLVATTYCAVIALAIAGSPAGAAPTPMPEHFCNRPVVSRGLAYGVDGSGVRCNFMRFWTARWLDHRGEPRGWNCIDLGEGGDCQKRHAKAFFEYYAFD
jgi:hypothetical protein